LGSAFHSRALRRHGAILTRHHAPPVGRSPAGRATSTIEHCAEIALGSSSHMRATVVSISDSRSHPRSHFVHCRLMRQRRAAPAEQPAEAWATSSAGGVGATPPAGSILVVARFESSPALAAAERGPHSTAGWLRRHFMKASLQFSRGYRGLLGVPHASGLSRGAAPRGATAVCQTVPSR